MDLLLYTCGAKPNAELDRLKPINIDTISICNSLPKLRLAVVKGVWGGV